jgi:hypothetical protein
VSKSTNWYFGSLVPARDHRRDVDRHHGAVRDRLGLLERLPPPVPGAGDGAERRRSIGLIFLGRFAFDVVQSVSTFASLIITSPRRGWS